VGSPVGEGALAWLVAVDSAPSGTGGRGGLASPGAAAEAHTGPVRRIRQQMADADLGLAAWLADHPFLVPAQEVESGESGVSLLLLLEVDHQQAFPSQGG